VWQANTTLDSNPRDDAGTVIDNDETKINLQSLPKIDWQGRARCSDGMQRLPPPQHNQNPKKRSNINNNHNNKVESVNSVGQAVSCTYCARRFHHLTQ